MFPRPKARKSSTPSLYSISGASSLTSIISTASNASLTRSASPSSFAPDPNPSPNDNNPATPPEEFIYPIPFSGDISETTPLLANRHQSPCNNRRPCTCICRHPHPNLKHNVRTPENPSTRKSSSIHFRYRSIQIPRSTLLHLKITTGVLSIFCLSVVVLSPHSNRTENGSPTLERNLTSPEQHDTLTSLHGTGGPLETQTQIQTHKLNNPQLKGIEFAIVCFGIFTICSGIRAASYVMSRWGLCFGGEGSDGNAGILGDEEEMMGYRERREEVVDDMV
ncbi:uncharacterized protein EAF01_004655 [Botrytis porri]|uniref:Uncharacterized protein n=1 Tax=Botrytis porri TaxID=87229 RepID=A0A4Z1K8L4_9HELO|nr:uncharacterized protein EAF01_004655 [Botrytis porri]KAF7907068.1 hypothetical protein EAF01_004655 [Botrytis porri]TGO82000.1 hypothetical protein BPOR_0949g00030 [Botrytis porri]